MTEMKARAFGLIDNWRPEMLALWETLVNMESGTPDKEDVDKVALVLKKTIDAFGGSAQILEYPKAGNSIVATFGKRTEKAPFCFLGHYDTVFPHGTAAKRPFRIEGENAYGPGVLDMKAGVVIQIFAARALLEAGYDERQIKMILAGDEETGHPDSDMDAVFENESKGAIAAINFETGDISEALVVGRKGAASYDMVVTGVAVHAGREPENGRSAILEIAHKIIDIQALTDFEKGITFNVGIVKGGVARNAVPDRAEIEIDVRVMEAEQLDYVDREIQKITKKTYIDGTSTRCTRDAGIAPMPRTQGNERLFEYVREIAAGLGLPVPHAILSGGGSDSAYSVKAGVPTIDQMGVKGQWNHSDREYAVVETLFERAKLAIACVLDIDTFEATH